MQGNQTKNDVRPPLAVLNYTLDKACLSYQGEQQWSQGWSASSRDVISRDNLPMGLHIVSKALSAGASGSQQSTTR